MKKLRSLLQKIIKYRQASVNILFVDTKIVVYEWVLFNKIIIRRTFKSL